MLVYIFCETNNKFNLSNQHVFEIAIELCHQNKINLLTYEILPRNYTHVFCINFTRLTVVINSAEDNIKFVVCKNFITSGCYKSLQTRFVA